MDLTFSTVSQTPKLSTKRHHSNTPRTRSSIDSAKLKQTFERSIAQNEYLLLRNRLHKLSQIESIMQKEISLAHQKSKEIYNLQLENLKKAHNKSLHQQDKNKKIEDKRLNFSLSRAQRRQKREDSFKELFMYKKGKADQIKGLKKNWENHVRKRKETEVHQKMEIAEKIKRINMNHSENRAASQASKRCELNLRYNKSINDQKELAFSFRKKISKLEMAELKLVENLSNTISVRNSQISGLNQLIAISKLPISQRISYSP